MLVSTDIDRSQEIMRRLASEYEIWHVARQRDAMAYLKMHSLHAVIVDLDALGPDAGNFLDAIRGSERHRATLLIGFSRNPEMIAPSLAARLGRVLRD